MNRIATELVLIARELLGMEFDTKEEMEQYKKDHKVRTDTKLVVKKRENKQPEKERTRGKVVVNKDRAEDKERFIVIRHTAPVSALKGILERGLLSNGSDVYAGGKEWKEAPDSPYFKDKGSDFVRIDISLTPEEASKHLGFRFGYDVLDAIDPKQTREKRVKMMKSKTPIRLSKDEMEKYKEYLKHKEGVGENIFTVVKEIPPSKIHGYEHLQ